MGYDEDSKEDKVFIAEGKNEDGTFINPEELSITHTDFMYIAGIIRAEDSSTFESAAATTQATFNAVKLVKGGSISMSEQSQYAAKLLASDYSSVPNKEALSVNDASQSDLNSRKGLMHVLQGGKDFSGGAVAWDGIDFAIKGDTHPKGKYGGFSVSESLWKQFIGTYNWSSNQGKGIKYKGSYYNSPTRLTFTDGNFSKTGTHKYSLGRTAYKASTVHGQHIFWSPNRGDNRNKGYNFKDLVQGFFK